MSLTHLGKNHLIFTLSVKSSTESDQFHLSLIWCFSPSRHQPLGPHCATHTCSMGSGTNLFRESLGDCGHQGGYGKGFLLGLRGRGAYTRLIPTGAHG